MPGDRVELEVRLTGVGAIQAGMRQVATAINGPLEGLVATVKSKAAALGTALVAGFAVHKFVEQFGEAVSAMEHAAVAAQKLGIGVAQMSALEYAARLSQTTVEDFEGALKKLAKAVGENSDAFETLHIDLRDEEDGTLRKLPDIMMDVADAFAAMPNGVAKSSLALKLFGKDGVAMIPMLNQGRDGIRELMQEAEQFGQVVNEDSAARALEFKDNLERLTMAVGGLFKEVAAQLLPTLLDLSERLLSWVKEHDLVRRGADLLSEALRFMAFMVEELIVVLGVLYATWQTEMEGLSKVIDAVKRAWEDALATPAQLIHGMVSALQLAIRAVADLAESLALLAARKFTEAKDRAKRASGEMIAALAEAGASGLAAVVKNGSNAMNVWTTMLNTTQATVDKFIAAGKVGIAQLMGTFLNLWLFPPKKPKPIPGFSPDLTDVDLPDKNAQAEYRERVAEELREQEAEIHKRRQILANNEALLEGNFAQTDEEKYRQRIALAHEDVDLLDKQIAKLRERQALETDQEVKRDIGTSIRGLEGQRESSFGKYQKLAQSADPNSYRDQMLSTMTQLQNQMGTTAQSVARQFASVIGNAIDGVQQGIEGLIKGTMTWGDALRHIGSSIINGVISAISRMFAEWIAKRAIMALKNILFSQQEGAADVAAKAPGALMSSISSWGVAALVGTAALIAALAAFGAFAEGGIVRGPGGPTDDSVVARLSAGEGVVNAAAVRFYGEGIIHAMNSRTARFYGSPATATGATAENTRLGPASPARTPVSSNVSLVLVDDRAEAKSYLDRSAGEAHVMRIVRKNRLQLGVRG